MSTINKFGYSGWRVNSGKNPNFDFRSGKVLFTHKKAPATISNWGYNPKKVRIFNWLPDRGKYPNFSIELIIGLNRVKSSYVFTF